MRILVADTDEPTRRSLEAALSRSGHEVLSATNGEEAWEILKGPNAPRLLILDSEMPKADRSGLCRRIRERSEQFFTYVLLLTTYDKCADMSACLAAGADDYTTKPLDPHELNARLAVGERVLQLHDEIVMAHQLLEISARTDYLTHLLNRRALIDRIEQELSRALRENLPVALAKIDVDHLAEVNNTCGQLVGDQVLIEIAQRIANTCRPYDVVGRLGGEEFLVFMVGLSCPAVEVVAERIRSVIADEPIDTSSQVVSISVSIGAVWAPVPGTPVANSLIHLAHNMLTEAKAAGCNQTKFSPFGIAPEKPSIRRADAS